MEEYAPPMPHRNPPANVNVLIQRHVDSGSVRRRRILAHCAHIKPEARLFHVEVRQDCNNYRQLNVDSLGEQRVPQHGNIAQHRDIIRRKGAAHLRGDCQAGVFHAFGHFHASDESGNAGAEDGQHKSRNDLVAPERDGDERIYQRSHKPGNSGAEYRDNRI
jgi:hypothetical protein